MRIAYMLADPGIGVFGTKGASVHVQEMIRAFRALGHEVTVFATKRGRRNDDATTEHVPADLKDLPVFVVPVSGASSAADREESISRTAARMAELAAEGNFDLVYERYSLFSTAGAQLKSRYSSDTPESVPALVVEVNAHLLAEQAEHRTLHNAQAAMRSTLHTFAAADVISCVSEPLAEWVGGLLNDSTNGEIVVNPNGVDPERFSQSGRGVSEDEHHRFTVGFLGTLKPWHGTDTLLKACAAELAGADIPWQCEILGDGPQRGQLEDLADSLGIRDRVIFHGAVAPEDVPSALGKWDVGVAPYPAAIRHKDHYFSPLKVYEYMAAGLPVVASNIGEIPEVIKEGETGLLVPGSNPAALGAALGRLEREPETRARMGAAARTCACEHHSWLSRAKVLLEVLGRHGCATGSLTHSAVETC